MKISRKKTYEVWALDFDGKQIATSIVDMFSNLREIHHTVKQQFWNKTIKTIHIYCINDGSYAVYNSNMVRLVQLY